MTNYYNPQVWQGRISPTVRVIESLDPTNYYALAASETICFPWGFASTQQVLFTAMHQEFWARQQFSIRAWASLEPAGTSITKSPFASQSSISLSGSPSTWLFFQAPYQGSMLAGIMHDAPVDQCLWFNLRNACNEDNRAFLQIETLLL